MYAPKKPLLFLKPTAALNPEARQAIATADLIVISPGSIFTSTLAALAVDGMCEELADTRAVKVLVTNLMTERLHTSGWHVADFVTSLERHGVTVDVALYNTQMPDDASLRSYSAQGQWPVGTAEKKFERMAGVHTVGAPLLAMAKAVPDVNDDVVRSVVRHDARAVRRALWSILAERQAAI